MADTIKRQDAVAVIEAIAARINAINSNAGCVAREATAAINALPAVTITDDMVERAATAFYNACCEMDDAGAMRAALLAALAD